MYLSPFVLLLLLIVSLSSYYSTNAQSTLYDFNLNTRVNVGGKPHFKINYYPGSSNASYQGDFYPDVESVTTVTKYTILSNANLNDGTELRSPYVSLSPAWAESTLYYTYNPAVVLIIPSGVTIYINGATTQYSTILVKGKLVLGSQYSVNFNIGKLIIFPGGVFESQPLSTMNHTITLNPMNVVWDPLKTSPFISLGGNVTIGGTTTTSVWHGLNSSYVGYSYQSTFLKSFPTPLTNDPVFRMGGVESSNNVQYSMKNFYSPIVSGSSGQYVDSSFGGAGYIYMRPYKKNVFIKGIGSSSMVFTGPSFIDIQHIAITDVGHTTTNELNEHVLTPNGVNYDITTVGTNPSDRYPITLLHVTQPVIIQNCMFFEVPSTSTKYSLSPRSFIAAKRSFGNIIGNAFALKGASGISLLHGTEAFTIGFNSFISLYSDQTTPATRSYPDINHLNGGIVSTSPYSTYDSNAFEGKFKGGAIQLIPIQSRSTVIGLASDLLLGPTWSGLTQDNTNSLKTNSVWNNLIYSNNFFAGESEFRFTYSTSSQPPIKINLFAGWLINLVASKTLAANVGNIEFVLDSPYIANTLSINDKMITFLNNAFNGQFNSISIKNSYAPCSYKLFSNTFYVKYMSIRNSIFSHESNSVSSTFLTQYTGQSYFENVNGTKLSLYNLIPIFYPFYKLEMKTGTVNGLLNNQIGFTLVPNFDFSDSNGQSLTFLIDQVNYSPSYESHLYNDGLHTNNFITNVTSISKVISFDSNFGNGPYNLMVTSDSYYAPDYTGAGPYFAHTYVHDKLCVNFYMGISLSSNSFGSTPQAISIFGNQWTTCQWFNSRCTVTGSYSSVSPTPTSISTVSSTGVITSVTSSNELVMLSSYLSSTVSTSTPSVVNILLGQGVYKFYIYTYNPTWTGSSVLDSLPLYTIKVGGKYQEPFTRSTPSYQKYQKVGPFFWNNIGTTDQTLVIEWASDNIKYSIPICGIELFSTSSTPYPVFP